MEENEKNIKKEEKTPEVFDVKIDEETVRVSEVAEENEKKKEEVFIGNKYEEKKSKQIKINLKEVVIILMAFICIVLAVYELVAYLPKVFG